MNYFGGNERCSSSFSSVSSSSRKGKRNGSDKQPRQPQRGLGVAQLEKIRLHTQMSGYFLQEDIRNQSPYYSSSSSSFSYPLPSIASFTTLPGHHSHMTGMGEFDRPNIIYGESHISTIDHRWDASCGMLEVQSYTQPAVRRQFFSPELPEDSLRKNKKKDQNNSMGSSSCQNSDSNGNQELDLELRLSL